MLEFHPLRSARWEPIWSALVAAAIGAAISLGSGLLQHWEIPWAGAPFLAAICGGLVWIFDHAIWMQILDRSYTPAPAQAAAPQEEALEEFDPTRIEIKCKAPDSNDTHILHDLPIEYTDLFDYANGIMRDHRPTVFSEWIGPRAMGKLWSDQEDYKKLVNWMVRWRYGDKDHRGVLKINKRGEDLLEDVLHQDFSNLSPTGSGDMAKIHIPHLTKLNQ